MKERKRKKLARRETQLYHSVDDTQETAKETSSDETTAKLFQLEKVYQEKKKVKFL